MSRGRKSEYPFRPDKKGRPKSTHKGSRKARCWFEGGKYIFPVDNRLVSRLAGCSSSTDNNPAYRAFQSAYGMNKVPVHDWGKHGRTLLV